MQKVIKTATHLCCFFVGLIVGAYFLGYPIGAKEEAIKVNLIWNLNDVYVSERILKSNISKDEAFAQISANAFDRHAHMLDQIEHSLVMSYILRSKSELRLGVLKMREKSNGKKN